MSTFTIDTSTSRATPSPVPGKRTTAPSIRARKVPKDNGFGIEQPIVMLTAYTMRMAQLLDPHCDMLLVGDSLGQVIYGLPSTIPVTMEMMCAHGAAVVRGSWHALVGVDMPFGSYEGSPDQAFVSASRIMKETGCAAVKLEGGEAMAPTIHFLSERGIPVIGHVGLTPQAVNVLGGYAARGKEISEAHKIEQDAKAVADAGAFCIVVEGVMEQVATNVARNVAPPVIGIGASAECDGQVLVTDDMLGMFERTPRFVKRPNAMK
jgi:3-methyl-2-oxobutanoate hydroxymethyltransferase